MSSITSRAHRGTCAPVQNRARAVNAAMMRPPGAPSIQIRTIHDTRTPTAIRMPISHRVQEAIEQLDAEAQRLGLSSSHDGIEGERLRHSSPGQPAKREAPWLEPGEGASERGARTRDAGSGAHEVPRPRQEQTDGGGAGRGHAAAGAAAPSTGVSWPGEARAGPSGPAVPGPPPYAAAGVAAGAPPAAAGSIDAASQAATDAPGVCITLRVGSAARVMEWGWVGFDRTA
jgi:hypothetical protein